MSKAALVFGASGVSGWSFINEILHDYPTAGLWKRAHALCNRPLTQRKSQWPKDPRLNIVSGIDLLAPSQEDLETELKVKIPEICDVTHVYYLAYTASDDMKKELEDAVDMFKKAVVAVDTLCPNLEFLVLQIGGKIYGIHILASIPWYSLQDEEARSQPVQLLDYIRPPYKESSPRIKPPYGDMLFYHHQIDFIDQYARGKRWSWCNTRPDMIIGFTPNTNFYSLASSIAVYLSLWRYIEGKGAKVPFPGTDKSWVALCHDSSSIMIARQSIHLSLSPTTANGEGYNIADAKEPSSWSKKWPVLCSEFGLEGTEPTEASREIRKYIKDNLGPWHQLEEEMALQTGHADSPKTFPGYEEFVMSSFNFDRQFDMTKTYSTGFTEERDTRQAWSEVFNRMRKAMIIPSA